MIDLTIQRIDNLYDVGETEGRKGLTETSFLDLPSLLGSYDGCRFALKYDRLSESQIIEAKQKMCNVKNEVMIRHNHRFGLILSAINADYITHKFKNRNK